LLKKCGERPLKVEAYNFSGANEHVGCVRHLQIRSFIPHLIRNAPKTPGGKNHDFHKVSLPEGPQNGQKGAKNGHFQPIFTKFRQKMPIFAQIMWRKTLKGQGAYFFRGKRACELRLAPPN